MGRKAKHRSLPLSRQITRANLDNRTNLARAFDEVKTSILDALGGQLSPQREYLLERAVFMVWRLTELERTMLAGKVDTNTREPFRKQRDALLHDYMALVGTLNRTLKTLGLNSVKGDGVDLAARMRELHQEGDT